MIAKKLKKGTVLKIVEAWMVACGRSKSIDVGSVRVIMDLQKGGKDDFILFDNGGGQDFFIWSPVIVGDKFNVQAMLDDSIGKYVYMYRKDGEEFITNAPAWGGLKQAIEECEQK
jgi:hypothetical protein